MKTVWILMLAMLGAAAVPSNKSAELVKRAKLSLPEAVEKAASEAKEGAPFSARLTEEKGRLVYSIGFARGETSLRVLIDASTAEIVSTSTEAKSRAKVVSGATVAMPKLIEAALAKVAGKATRISYELKKGKPFAEIIVVKDDKLFEVKTDATTGQVTKVEEEDDDDDEDDEDDD